MTYKVINSQEQLDELNHLVCWDDSYFIDAYVSCQRQSYFPRDIQHSGRSSHNYHCLYSVCSAPKSHLEIVFIGTEHIDHHKLEHMFLGGRVMSGGSVELTNNSSSITLKCAKIIYQFIQIDEIEGPGYFLKPGVLNYPNGDFNSLGYQHVENENCHLVISEAEKGVDITISDSNKNGSSINLNHDQVHKLAEILLQSLGRC